MPRPGSKISTGAPPQESSSSYLFMFVRDVEVENVKEGLRVTMFKKFPYHQDYRDVVYEDTRGYGTWCRLFPINDGAELFRPIPPPEGISLHNGILLIRLLCLDNIQVVKRARSTYEGESMANQSTYLSTGPTRYHHQHLNHIFKIQI